MKQWLLKELQKTAASLARRTLAKFKPTVVGVTGSVGKTSTKEAIYAVLSAHRSVRRTRANLNNELGFPLTILGDYENSGGYVFWFKVILFSMLRLAVPRRFVHFLGGYPEILVLEYGADKPGDIAYLTSIATPHIGILTAVGDIPVHVEFYDSPEAVLREKSRLIEAVPAAGLAVLNADEPRVHGAESKTRAAVLSYGFDSRCDVQIKDFENKTEQIGGVLRPTGITFKLGYEGSYVPVRIGGTLGKTQAYAAAAAACVGMAFNLNLVQIAEALAYYRVPAQRMRFLAGVHHTTLIDDCYNASPLSLISAIETVASIKAKRRVAIIGDMRELGEWSKEAHNEIGDIASKVFDVIIAIGPQSAVYVDWAIKRRIAKKNLVHALKVEEVLPILRDYVKEGDIVLIKASHSIGLDKAVAALQEI